MKKLSILLFLIGFVLFGVGMSMRAKQYAITHHQKGNKFLTGAIGAGTGAAVGAGAGAAVGGVGIAACGTGIGLPVGIVCLTAAAILGLAGAGVGAAVGTPDQTYVEMVNAYSPAEYWTVLIIGALLVATGIFTFFRSRKKENCETTT